MTTTQLATPLQPNSASTADWIGQVEDHVIYAYDLNSMVSQNAGSIGFIKRDLEQTSEQVCRKSNLPFGEHIREAIQIIKGNKD